MKRGLFLMSCTLLAFNFAGLATADPLFGKYFSKHYADENKDSDYAARVKAEKCLICHFGKKKKNKNDFGLALSKYLDRKNYKKSRVAGEPKKVEAELTEAFKKVLVIKNKEGKTFGELIKGGKLPGAPANATPQAGTE